MKRFFLQIRYWIVLLALLSSAAAQPPSSAPSTLSLQQIAERAGIIFSGTVQKIELDGDSAVRITFQVDEGICGAFSGQTITLREWRNAASSGLAPGLRAGDKLLAFFHATPPGGFTSPVAGAAGLLHFSDSETLRFTESQRAALMRSPRLRSLLPIGITVEPAHRRVSAADMVRALRLVTTSP
jgi:hypothetical protein